MSMEQYPSSCFTTLIAGISVIITNNTKTNFYNFHIMLFQLLSLRERKISMRDS